MITQIAKKKKWPSTEICFDERRAKQTEEKKRKCVLECVCEKETEVVREIEKWSVCNYGI